MSAAPVSAAPASTAAVPSAAVEAVSCGRRARGRRRRLIILLLAVLIAGMSLLSLSYGNTVYTLSEVRQVILGEQVPGASFTVGTLRLPRTALAVIVGICFGLGGVTFQTMLRNPLASPDIIGISSGASAAAAFAIIMLGLSGAQVSLVAIVAGLGVAALVYALSFRSGVAGTG